MSSTNHTTNYNLPQFLGSDKPAWLGDINPAFSAIDTAMKANADSASTAGTDATTANTNIGTMADLETTSKTTLVGAINEVNTIAGTAQGTANQAVADASAVDTKVNTFMTKFNLTNTSTFTALPVTGGSKSGTLTLAQNADGSIFKVYGKMQINGIGGNAVLAVTSPIAGMTGKYGVATGLFLATTPSEAYYVEAGGVDAMITDNNCESVAELNFAVGSDGQIYIFVRDNSANVTVSNGKYRRLIFPACVYFNANFGDTPQPE